MDEGAQDDPLPFVIDYTPEERTVGFTGNVASPAPFVVDIPAREPYSDGKVPWTYEGSIGSVEQQFSVMGVTRSGRVTEEEADAFMKIVKASEYKVVEQMARSPAHVSLLALLLGSEPHREALLRMNVDLNRVRPSKTAVRAFDGSRREVNGEIDLLIDVGPCSFSITFQVLDIPNAFSLLLGRPWIHLAGAVPSSLHQRLKFIVEEKLITSGPSRADRMIGKVLLRNNYIPGTGLGAHGQGISRPIEIGEYKHRRGLGFHPSCHEIIEARRGNHLHRLAAYYGRLNRGTLVPLLSHFFSGPSHTIGGTLDGPSSDSDDTPAAPSAVCTVTEEFPSGVHIRLAQENEELDNWISVPRYSAVIADV
ncbi:hypothetical protein CRG98_032849 [Punica granatum]|uniref:G-patch domain-containing protein n=1 Tax=Punica granatum TaxID=22663 RepID=A0A2I0IRZ7_PUNGR|nr:hypothetical protein CRG98_032849 [Punica granatum]